MFVNGSAIALSAALMLAAAPVSAEPLDYTFAENPADAEFRAIAQSVFDDHSGWPEVTSAACEVRAAGAARKLEDKFRKRHGLPAETALFYASCESAATQICHRSFYSGKAKCSAGEVDLYVNGIELDATGTSATSVGQLAFFGKKGRASGKVTQIFMYKYELLKEDAGWRVSDRRFVKMSDL